MGGWEKKEEDKVAAAAQDQDESHVSTSLFLFALSSVPNFSCPKIFYLRTTDRHNGKEKYGFRSHTRVVF